jgi:hypothetical protein
MKLELQNDLQSKKWYWKTKKWLKNGPIFVIWKKYFEIAYFTDEGKQSVGLLRGSIPSLCLGVLYAAISVFVFEYLNKIAPAQELFKLFGISQLSFDKQTIDSFLTTVASVSGVFLALYFASISSVAGNLLMKAPDKVRKLFLEEKEGSQYIRTLVLTGVISTFYLVFKSTGYEVSFYSLVFLLLLTIYNISVFRRLGMQLFSLKTSEGAATITGEISKSIKRATIPWKNNGKPFIQNHFSTRATFYLDTFDQLIDFGQEIFSTEQMRQFVRYAGGLLAFYPEQKRKIATASLWFKSRRQHKKWILTDSMEITLALNSGTGLSPTEIRDHIWFEREVSKIIKNLQDYFLKKKDKDSIVVSIEIYVQIFEMGLVQNLSIDESLLYINQLRDFTGRIYKTDMSQTDLVTVADSDGRIAIGNLLGFVRYIDVLTVQKIDKIFNKQKIINGDIYDGSIPQSMLNRAEQLSMNLKNEAIIEGKIDTPDWYVKTILTFYLLTEVKKYFEHLKSLHNTYYQTRVDQLITEGKVLVAAHLLQRWLEFCSKYQMCISVMAKTFTALAIHNKQFDLEWPTFDSEKEQTDAETFQNNATDKMTRLLPQLGANPSPGEDLPDYFGQAFTFGVEACYQAVEANNVERFKNLFPSVFVGSIVAFNTTRDDTKGWNEKSQIVFSSEPLTDLIEISGYAKLYAELFQNQELWEACKSVWDRYLTQEGSEQIVRIIVSTAAYRKGLFMIMPKGLLRTNWEIGFRRKMTEQGLISQDDMFGTRDRNRTINHASKLIRILARRSILPVHPDDIFFVTYLKSHPIARGIEFPEDRDHIEEQLSETENETDDENI